MALWRCAKDLLNASAVVLLPSETLRECGHHFLPAMCRYCCKSTKIPPAIFSKETKLNYARRLIWHPGLDQRWKTTFATKSAHSWPEPMRRLVRSWQKPTCDLRSSIGVWPPPPSVKWSQTARLKHGIFSCSGKGSHGNPHPTARIHCHAERRGGLASRGGRPTRCEGIACRLCRRAAERCADLRRVPKADGRAGLPGGQVLRVRIHPNSEHRRL